jgi:hypothetical protein
MPVKQISVFLENKCGRLASVTRTIGEHDINIRAFSIADTNDFGVLRLIVNRPEDTYEVLRQAGYTVNVTDVIAVEIPDRPGGLADVLDLMNEAGLNIEYMYAFVASVSREALAVFRVDNYSQAAIKLLNNKGIRVYTGDEIYNL